MTADAGKADWIRRVLGVETVQGETAQPSQGGTSLLSIWVAAKDQVDDGISALQAKLRDSPREGLRMIGEYGLAGLTDSQGVPMMVALRNLDAAPGSARARGKAAAATASFRKFLALNARLLSLLEGNSFGVKVSIAATFNAALGTIEQQISR